MGVRRDVSQLGPLDLVEMFIWDDRPIGGTTVFRWHPGTTVTKGPIFWQGVEYAPIPIEADGFDQDSTGKLPRPTLRISNIGGQIGAYIRQNWPLSDALGAKVTRKRTLGKYLDARNFQGGNAYANPNTAFADEIFYVARKANENPIFVELELAVRFDVEGVKLPRRQVIASTCQWAYRSTECGYTGKAITTDPVYPGVDKCGKTLESCRLRFGKGILRTSAFPASLLGKYV